MPIFFFFLMPSTNVEGKKNAPRWLMIVQSRKWGVCIYIMMIMKVAERLRQLSWSSWNSTGTHDFWQKGPLRLSAHVRFESDLGWRARLRRECQLSKRNFKDLKITRSFRNAFSWSEGWQGFSKEGEWWTNTARFKTEIDLLMVLSNIGGDLSLKQ